MAERKGSHGCCRLRTLAPHPRHRSSSIAPQVLQIGAVKARVWQDEAPRRRGTTRRSCAQRVCAAPLLQLCKLKQPRRAYGRRSRRARHDAPELRAQPILTRCAEAVGIVPGVAENLPMVKIHEISRMGLEERLGVIQLNISWR